MKKSFLTPVLAGVLAVTVVGSGVGYYFTFVKDSDADKDKDSKKDDKQVTLTVDEAAEKIEENLDKAQQIAKGELDIGYSAEVSYTMPAELAAQTGVDIKPFSMTMEAKQKDKMSALDYAINYDSKTVISANIVYDNENETAYVKIPELSDAFLTGTVSEIEALVEESSGMGAMEDFSTVDEYSIDGTAATVSLDEALEPTMAATSSEMMDAIAELDFEAILTDLASYADTIKENAPEPKDGENRKGEVDGVSYELTTKSYTITAADAKKMMTAVADKGRADTVLKDSLATLGVDEATYNSLWDDLSDIDEADESSLTFDAYYCGDEFAGWSVSDPDSDETLYMICAATDTDLVIDWDLSTEGETMTVKGAVSVDGDTLDGTIKMDVSDEYSSTNMEIKYDSLTVTDDSLKGTVSSTITSDGETVTVNCTFNNTADKIDTSFTMNAAGQDLGTIKVTAQETNASDISIPTGTAYKLTDETELEQYLSTCDLEGWQASLKDTLGEDLYNMIFGMSDASSYDYDDYEDYDFEDYDFDDMDGLEDLTSIAI